MNRRGGVSVGVLDCHCGGGEEAGLVLRNDSGVVARSSSVFSRSVSFNRIFLCLHNIPVPSVFVAAVLCLDYWIIFGVS